jgi:D-alanyl-D-alanine carboxypeptidase/D-alanyl-D-alanine-endopeptidase (penicillin-binding protein 4)
MLKYSNNVIANQLLLTQDLARHGPPAALDRAARAATAQLRELTAEADSRVTLAEGSGISRSNSISAAAMLALLQRFHPWRHLLSDYVSDGRAAPAKTGNLRGVYTLAGYLPTADGEGRAFVVLLNQRRNTRAAVFRTLHRAFAEKAPTRNRPAVE